MNRFRECDAPDWCWHLYRPKVSDSRRRSAPISCALDVCENTRHTNGYASVFSKRQSIKILAHLIHQNRSP
jgi:hypothetical protein